MAVQVFSSADTGAPALNGSAVGKLTDLLDAVLVDGYGSGTASSVTRSGDIATVTLTAHGFNTGDYVEVSGAVQTAYNGKVKVTVSSSSVFTYTVTGTPTTPATGTILAKRAAVGWAKTTIGTNYKAYRQPSGSNQFYLVCEDNDDDLYSQVYGAESLDSGNANAPLSTFPKEQVVNSVRFPRTYVVPRSWTAESNKSTARSWYLVTNGKFVIFIIGYVSSSYYGNGFLFGDCDPFGASDSAFTIMAGSCEATVASTRAAISADDFDVRTAVSVINPGIINSSYAIDVRFCSARNSSGSGACSPIIYNVGINAIINSSAAGVLSATFDSYLAPPYPCPISGGLNYSPIQIFEPPSSCGGAHSTSSPRGIVPGMIVPYHSGMDTDGTIIDGVGANAGRKWIVKRANYQSTEAYVVVEISDTW